MEESISNSPHPVVKTIYDAVNKSDIDETSRNVIFILLATYLNDTAYRDIGDFMIYRINEHLEEIGEAQANGKKYHDLGIQIVGMITANMSEILNQIDDKPPNEWYYNRWEEAKAKTQRMRQSGELAPNECCFEEMQLVEAYQQQRKTDYEKSIGG